MQLTPTTSWTGPKNFPDTTAMQQLMKCTSFPSQQTLVWTDVLHLDKRWNIQTKWTLLKLWTRRFKRTNIVNIGQWSLEGHCPNVPNPSKKYGHPSVNIDPLVPFSSIKYRYVHMDAYNNGDPNTGKLTLLLSIWWVCNCYYQLHIFTSSNLKPYNYSGFSTSRLGCRYMDVSII